MERKKTKSDALEQEKVRLERRHGEIGISAVKAAAQCRGQPEQSRGRIMRGKAKADHHRAEKSNSP